MDQELPFSEEATATVAAPLDAVFAFLDDHGNLSAHMSKSSWMMLGSRMEIHVDAAGAREVGSRFGFKGSLLGIALSVDEIVTRREPFKVKTWETVGEPILWVIGRYRMGFQLTPRGRSSLLRVFISYALPRSWPARWFGLVLGRVYARWCTARMAGDAAKHFRESAAPSTMLTAQ